MLDETVRQAAWKEYQDLVTLWNSENAKIDAGYYDQWKQDHDNATATGRIPQPKRPYHLRMNATDDGKGWPAFTYGTDYVFTEPIPISPVPDPGQTLSWTDATGVVHKGKYVTSPFGGHSIDWGI